VLGGGSPEELLLHRKEILAFQTNPGAMVAARFTSDAR
jgi:hypothetical protein